MDNDYSFVVTTLNPLEGPPSSPLTVRSGAIPDPPTSITEIPGTRTGTSIGL